MARPIVHLIVAARPNFMKVAPLWHALVADGTYDVRLVHTGQHYDANMSDAFSGIWACRSRTTTSGWAAAVTRSRRPG